MAVIQMTDDRFEEVVLKSELPVMESNELKLWQ